MNEDVLIEILSRLPVKSLMRFTAVSKTWHAFVKTPTFISKHLQNRDNITHLLVSHRDKLSEKRLVSSFPNDNLKKFVILQGPPILNESFGHIRLIGPCNGLVCLYGYPDNIALWNPSMREFKTLPISRIPRPPEAKILGGDIGFGFDSKTNDYKVVQILFLSFTLLGVSYQVEIYTLSTDSWRKFDAFVPAKIMYLNVWSMLYGREIFCWWGKDGDIEVILSFDMVDEEFKKTPFPSDIEEFGGEERTTRAIVPMNESLALIVYRVKQVDKLFDLWVLNEIGGKESWTKLSAIGPISRVERLLGFWTNGEIILENSYGELVLYDSRTRKNTNLELQGKRGRLEVVVYKESLVSLEM